MRLFLFRCQCGWEKADHEFDNEDNKLKPWTPNDVKLDKTNAYGEIEFHDAKKSTEAEVTMKLRWILSQRALLSMFSKIGKAKQEILELFRGASSIFFI